jgi:hypothetical protein
MRRIGRVSHGRSRRTTIDAVSVEYRQENRGLVTRQTVRTLDGSRWFVRKRKVLWILREGNSAVGLQ